MSPVSTSDATAANNTVPTIDDYNGCENGSLETCHPGEVITLIGSDFLPGPVNETSVIISSKNNTYSCDVHQITNTNLQCQLPGFVPSYDRGINLNLVVRAGNATSKPFDSLTFATADLSLSDVIGTGCDNQNPTDHATGCKAGSQFFLRGTAITNPCTLYLTHEHFNKSYGLAVMRGNIMSYILLPTLDPVSISLPFDAQVFCGVWSNTLPAALSYLPATDPSKSSSSSSAAPYLSSSSTASDNSSTAISSTGSSNEAGAFDWVTLPVMIAVPTSTVCIVLLVIALLVMWRRRMAKSENPQLLLNENASDLHAPLV